MKFKPFKDLKKFLKSAWKTIKKFFRGKSKKHRPNPVTNVHIEVL